MYKTFSLKKLIKNVSKLQLHTLWKLSIIRTIYFKTPFIQFYVSHWEIRDKRHGIEWKF